MSTQTVYFNNPADITALQQSNTWSRGQFVSADLIYTVPAYCWTGPLPGNVGPAQPVNVYKLVYYSSDSTTTSVQRVSATVFVPQAGVSKTGSLVVYHKGLTTGNNVSAVSWETYANTTFQAAVTAASASNATKLNPTSTLSAGYAMFSPNVLANLAGLGYIVADADGFGLGVSQNDCVFNYMSNINPHVDMIRCLRNMYASSVTAQRNVFNGAIYDANAFPITYVGYSLGGMFGVPAINEFSAGVSATIPSTESSKILFKRAIMGGSPDASTVSELVFNTNIGNYINNNTNTFLFSSAMANQPALAGIAQPDSLSTYWTFWQDIDQKPTLSADVAQVGTLLLYSYAVSPPTSAGTDGFYVPVSSLGATGTDFRQLFKPSSTGTVSKLLKTTLAGWGNPNRPLYTLPSIGVTNVYSTLDEVCCPYGYTGGYNANYPQQAGYNFDCASAMDKYMTTGESFLGGLVYFTGANKTKTVTEVTDTNGAGISTVATAVLSATTSTSSNTYARIRVNLSTGGLSALGSHSTFGGTYFGTVVYSCLASLTNAN